MKTIHSLVKVGAIAATAMLAACQQEPYIDNGASQAKNEYIKSWIQAFGLIDQEHTWNVAESITAQVYPEAYGPGVTVYIYSQSPASGGRLIGRASSAATLTMDVAKGSKRVFVQARDRSGHVFAHTYMPIIDGRVQIGATASRAARGAGVTYGEAKVYDNGAIQANRVYDPTYTLLDAVMAGDEEFAWFTGRIETIDYDWGWEVSSTKCLEFTDINDKYFWIPANASYILRSLGYSYWGGLSDEEYATYNNQFDKSTWCRLYPASPRVVYQHLNGVETSRECEIRVEDLLPVFGRDAYFEESASPSCLYKWRERFAPNVTYLVSGKVELDYMYGATANQNVFGYYYWQDGENPSEAVRYVLIDDATPHNNISVNGTYLSSGMQLSTYMLTPGLIPDGAFLTGTTFTVPYFDKNGVEDPNGFPDGTHLAFFLIANGQSQNSNWPVQTNYSVREHNLEFHRTFTGYQADGSDGGDNSLGEIDAISFRYNGVIYLGFEDRGGDKDMNDIVFFVRGDVEADEPQAAPMPGLMMMSMIIDLDVDDPFAPVLPPATDPTDPGDGDDLGQTETGGEDPGVIPGAGAQSWIVACEDLGSTGDYDFNDIVFSVSHVAGDTKAVVTPLAAGGLYRAVVYYNGAPIKGTEDESEIHNMILGRIDPSYQIINTTGGITPGRSFLIDCDPDFSITRDLGLFSIKVTGMGETVQIYAPLKGDVPQMLCLPGDWRWPREQVDITTAYPSFKAWNSDNTNTGWVSNVTPGCVVNR